MLLPADRRLRFEKEFQWAGLGWAEGLLISHLFLSWAAWAGL